MTAAIVTVVIRRSGEVVSAVVVKGIGFAIAAQLRVRGYGYCLACDFGIGALLARCSTGANQIISAAMSDIDTEEKPPVPLKDRKAWQEGYRAGRRGLVAGANPYPLGTIEAVTWRSGLFVGRRKRLGVVAGGRCD